MKCYCPYHRSIIEVFNEGGWLNPVLNFGASHLPKHLTQIKMLVPSMNMYCDYKVNDCVEECIRRLELTRGKK